MDQNLGVALLQKIMCLGLANGKILFPSPFLKDKVKDLARNSLHTAHRQMIIKSIEWEGCIVCGGVGVC